MGNMRVANIAARLILISVFIFVTGTAEPQLDPTVPPVAQGKLWQKS
ncbi:uncharacterized protein METZ01_LOCUS279490, partial [marine metagenome]